MKKIADIQSRIEEATLLREEAQNLLAATKRKLTEAEKEGEDIIATARDEAQILRQRMTDDLEASLKRREKQAVDRIAQAEADATSEVRAIAADLAIDATRTLLADEAQGDKAASLIDDAIQDLNGIPVVFLLNQPLRARQLGSHLGWSELSRGVGSGRIRPAGAESHESHK